MYAILSLVLVFVTLSVLFCIKDSYSERRKTESANKQNSVTREHEDQFIKFVSKGKQCKKYSKQWKNKSDVSLKNGSNKFSGAPTQSTATNEAAQKSEGVKSDEDNPYAMLLNTHVKSISLYMNENANDNQ